jgi:hypothetical protein
MGLNCAKINYFGRNVSIDDHLPKPETKSANQYFGTKNDMGKSYIKSCDFQKILVRNLMHDFVPFKIYVYFAFACLQTLLLSVFMSACTLPIMLAHQLVFLGDLGVEKASFIQLLGLAKVGSAHTCCDTCTVSYFQ